MPGVTIRTEKVVISMLGTGIVFQDERLKYPLEYIVQHLSVCLPLLFQLYQTNIPILDRNWQDSDHYSQIFSGWVEVKATLPTGKLELLTVELHPPTRRWESVNPLAGS